MNNSPNPQQPGHFSWKAIIEGVIVGVIVGLIVAYIIQDARFDPSRTPTATPTVATSESENTPVVHPSTTTIPQNTPLEDTATITSNQPDAVVASTAINLRSGPDTTFDILATYDRGTGIKMISRNSESSWVKVATPDGHVGWMSASLLTINLDLAVIPIEEFAGNPASETPPLPISSDISYEITNWTDTSSVNGWRTNDTWKVANGQLLNDGQSFGRRKTATAPVSLDGTQNYVVEAEIKLITYERGGIFASASFGIIVQASDDNSGYGAGHYAFAGGPYQAVIWEVPDGRVLHEDIEFRPRTDWHTYRVEVRGNIVTLLIDGVVQDSVENNSFLKGEHVGLWSDGAQISVRRFTVKPLD